MFKIFDKLIIHKIKVQILKNNWDKFQLNDSKF